MFVRLALLSVFLLPLALQAAYHDHNFYSAVLKETRPFRAYTGKNFDPSGAKRYPVIYYCHGCQGSYQGDQYGSYQTDGQYTPEYCLTNSCVYPYTKPYNADFQDFTDKNDVIIVMLDGNVSGMGGCNVWVPYQNAGWTGPEYRFALHFREIIHTVDSLYPTRPTAQARAVSGLSMGGHSALWLAASNPDLIRSLSTFCHSPVYFNIGGPDYTTAVDVTQLWRNYRGLSTRTSGNSGDYLYPYSRTLSLHLDGAGLEHEYHLTDFFRHWAADVDSQFLFHMRTFRQVRPMPPACFSHVNLYPSFDAWGYGISSQKRDTGWIYLKDVTRSGFGLVTRKWLPFGCPMPPFNVTVSTPRYYPLTSGYRVTRYNYRTGLFSSGNQAPDSLGRLVVSCTGGMGEEIGVMSAGMPAPLALLADTMCENIYITQGQDTAISGIIANLSGVAISGASVIVSSVSPLVTVANGLHALGTLPADNTVRLDTLAILRGRVAVDTAESLAVQFWSEKNIGFIKVRFQGGGADTSKEHLIQVHVAKEMLWLDSSQVKIFDGRSENLNVFVASDWSQNYSYQNTVYVSEGAGNGDGRPDSGEVFSVWVRLPMGLSGRDTNTWHPTVPTNGMSMPGYSSVSMKSYLWNRGRHVLSAQIKMNRGLSMSNPMELRLRAEVLRSYSGGQQRRDAFEFRYCRVALPKGHPINIEKITPPGHTGHLTLSAIPNPANPAVNLRFFLPEKTPVKVRIMDLNGREIRLSLNNKEYDAGLHNMPLDMEEWASGVYICRLEAGGHASTIKILLLR